MLMWLPLASPQALHPRSGKFPHLHLPSAAWIPQERRRWSPWGVLLLHPMNAYLEQELDRRCRLVCLWDSPLDCRADFLCAHAASIRAVVGNSNYGADAALIDALPSLEIVASFSVGIDRVNLAKCRERGIRVTNTPDVLIDDVADLAIAALRRIPQADRYVCAGMWKAKGDYTIPTRVGLLRVGGGGVIRELVNAGPRAMWPMRPGPHAFAIEWRVSGLIFVGSFCGAGLWLSEVAHPYLHP